MTSSKATRNDRFRSRQCAKDKKLSCPTPACQTTSISPRLFRVELQFAFIECQTLIILEASGRTHGFGHTRCKIGVEIFLRTGATVTILQQLANNFARFKARVLDRFSGFFSDCLTMNRFTSPVKFNHRNIWRPFGLGIAQQVMAYLQHRGFTQGRYITPFFICAG